MSITQKVLKISCVLALSLTPAFAFKQYDTFEGQNIKQNNTDTTYVAGSYRYYSKGIEDTILVYKNEVIKAHLYETMTLNTQNRYLVYINIDKTPINDVIFFKAAALKTNMLDAVVIKNLRNNQKFMLFGIFDNEIDANFALSKISQYNIPAKKIFNIKDNFEYDKMLLNILDENMKTYFEKHFPVKVFVVEKKKIVKGNDLCELDSKGKIIINNNNAILPGGVKVKKMPNITIKKATGASNNKSKNNKNNKNSKNTKNDNKNKKQTPEKTAEQKAKELREKCLNKTIADLRSYALFNLNTLQFKYQKQTYSKGDMLASSNPECEPFKITDIYKVSDKKMAIQFDDFKNKKMVATLKYLSSDFIPIGNLFYDPAKDKEKTFVTPESRTQANIDKKAEVKKETNHNITTKNCNFNPINGIRTQLVANSNGQYDKKPVYKFYQGKTLPVTFYKSGENYIISNQSGQKMLISGIDFEENCN